jgi:hypothetical protein
MTALGNIPANTDLDGYIDGVATGVTGTKGSLLATQSGVDLATNDKLIVVDTSAAVTEGMEISEIIIGLRRLALLPQYAFKTGDQANSTVNFSDVTDMAMAMEASTDYFAYWDLFVTAAATTTGLVIGVNGPASPTSVKLAMVSPTGATAIFAGGATAYETAVTATGVISTTVPTLVSVAAHIRNGTTAGNLQLRMRSEINASAVNILRGSRMQMQRIP